LLKELGENVRRLRQKTGYTQEQLAELVDVHSRMIQKIEFGQTNILATTAMRLRAALECEWADLMPDVEKPKLRVKPRR
jgi:transcriptional regulator with XRE-family HTH domain